MLFRSLIRTGLWPTGFDPRETVLLDPGDAEKFATLINAFGPASDQRATARLQDYTPTEIVVQTTSVRPGVLVLNDVWHPWWFAEIDGAAAPVLRANGLFRAVVLPQGEHEIRFRFRPMLGAWNQIVSSLVAGFKN